MNRVVLERPLDLDLTLYPSFTLAFYEKQGQSYVKVVGSRRGALRADGRVLEYQGFNEEEALLLSGAWLDPYREASQLPRSAKSRIWPLLEAYSCLGLAIDPIDRSWVFVSVALSRHTDFHVNVVKWVKKLAALANDPLRITEETALKAGTSFQLKQLPIQLKHYDMLGEEKLGVDEARLALQRIPWIGPKAATAYLLFTRAEAKHLAPADVHFQKTARRLGLVDYEIPWNPQLCSKNVCADCKDRHRCLHWKARTEYQGLAGWLQTACYVHDKLYCLRRRCGECTLRSICYGL